MGLSNAERQRRYREKQKTTRVRARKVKEESPAEKKLRLHNEGFPVTVLSELRQAIRQGCLLPLEHWVDGEGKLRGLREVLWDDGDYERLFNERQRAAEAAGEWPEVEDVVLPELDPLTGRYGAVADAVAATAAKLGIGLVNPSR